MAINSPLGSAAPKLGKSLISSSVFSAPIAAPKMQSSKLLDIDTDQLKTNVDRVDDIVALENRVATNEKKITITKNILKLQQQNRTKVNESLSEVNNILTDIGSALALDFANRISNEQEEAKEQKRRRLYLRGFWRLPFKLPHTASRPGIRKSRFDFRLNK